MKWLEMDNNNFYQPFDDKQKVIRGYWLIKQKINLEKLPEIFNEQFKKFDRRESDKEVYEQRKVYLDEIVGTSHNDYGGMKIIQAYIRLKRADMYILDNMVSKIKYNKMLRKNIVEQEIPVILSQNEDGTYFVDGNGNHRIILYKMMMYSEIATMSQKSTESLFYNNSISINDIKKKYWLIASIKK